MVLPGFDGELHSAEGNAWVPAGHSCWEVSCRADVATKANEDFNKRSAASSPEFRTERVFVQVTPRRWRDKEKWASAKAATGLWKDVRAYDAVDLEHWLEQSSAVALAFGEELGLGGPGVESLGAYLLKWGAQCAPAISAEALLVGRDEQAAKLVAKVEKIQNGLEREPVPIKADSVQEAAAFAAAALRHLSELGQAGVVVTTADGWRFVEKNAEIGLVIAATPEVAEAPTIRDGLALLVPYASGDMAKQFKGVAGRLNDAELHLERAMHSDFEKALQTIGVDENDSRRLASLCGRSWSVFRRQRAVNPAISRPAWLDHPASKALGTVCLVGAWSSSKDADKEILSRICGRPYEDLEQDLLELERLDDSPLLHIGSVWKAKSALELLAIFGERITKAELDRYFSEVEELLGTPDPKLELPDEKRYAAAIYGKIRPTSGLLLDSLCETLTKLAVHGPEVPALMTNGIQWRVDHMVRSLLHDADEVRWMSLSSQLPALAEASPNEFLTAVEIGIAEPDGPVRFLLKASNHHGISGSCWHAGLLWGLETLAWAPNRLVRVSIILARLSETEIGGNWGNSPKSSLLDLYRAWFPQTAATIEQRIAAIDAMIEKVPDAAYELLCGLTSAGPDHASHIARPKWRDDDAGAGYGTTRGEYGQMKVAAIDRQMEMAKGHVRRTRRLLKRYSDLDPERRARLIAMLVDFRDASDEDKVALRDGVRDKLHWHRNYDDDKDAEALQALLDPLEVAYQALEPKDLILRHMWLFGSGWVDLPVRVREEDTEARGNMTSQLCKAALGEIFESSEWPGALELAARSGNAWNVGSQIFHLGLPREELVRWIVEDAGELHAGEDATSIAGSIFNGLLHQDLHDNLEAVLEKAQGSGRDAIWITRLLILGRHDSVVWRAVEKLGTDAYYWTECSTNLWLDDPADMDFALRKLVAHKRPTSALRACYHKFEGYDPLLVMEMLEGVARGEEAGAEQLQGHVFGYAIDFIEDSGQIDDMRLVQLEFSIIRGLGFEEEERARTLYHVLMTHPDMFVELLCLLYKPRNGEHPDKDEHQKAVAELSWHILHACKRQPGTARDGTVDPQAFADFVAEARRLAKEQDRLEACDSTLGQILAHAPEGTDGIWPFEPARDFLENVATESLMSGLSCGVYNKRGASSRAYYEGGNQERGLALQYRAHAEALEASHPRLAAAVLNIARSYDRDGLFEDLEAKLRIEGH